MVSYLKMWTIPLDLLAKKTQSAINLFLIVTTTAIKEMRTCTFGPQHRISLKAVVNANLVTSLLMLLEKLLVMLAATLPPANKVVKCKTNSKLPNFVLNAKPIGI